MLSHLTERKTHMKNAWNETYFPLIQIEANEK